MLKRRNKFGLILTPILVCIGVLLGSDMRAREENVVPEANLEGYGIYLTISVAIMLTFLMYYGITMLARYIRETTGESFQGIEDSDG